MFSASLPLLVFVDTFANAERSNLTYQVKREWLVEWKLNRPGGSFVAGKLLGKGFDRRRRWVEADVMFERGERHQYPPVRIGWHAPLQTFSGSWRSGTNGGPHFAQLLSRLFRGGIDVFRNGSGFRFLRSHNLDLFSGTKTQMNKSLIVSQRLRNQRLTSTEFKKPVEVVRWLGAVQAQDFGAAKWAIGQRMQNATNESIEQDFNDGKVIRTHVMRPTWHFVSPEDIRWLLELTAPRVNIASGSAYRKFELDEHVFKQTNKVLARALRGGKHLTRRSLKNLLNESGVAADNSIRLGHILLRAELDGVICSGPREGNQFTYALFEERVPQTKRIDRERALATLTERYFTSHGPATVQDFMWWSGLTAIDAKNGINLVQRRLTKTSDGDRVFWGPKDGVAATRRASSASLLAEFDEYVVAYKDRSAVFDSDDRTAMANGALGRTVLIEGKIVGSWKQMKDKRNPRISVQLFRSLTETERLAIAKAVDRYAKFRGVETKPRLIYGKL